MLNGISLSWYYTEILKNLKSCLLPQDELGCTENKLVKGEGERFSVILQNHLSEKGLNFSPAS